MSKFYDVVIAGAGPVGLFLACELALANASVLVLERDLEHESPWKSAPLGFRGLNTLSVEALYRRGFLGSLFDLEERKKASSMAKKSGFQFAGHFAGMVLDANKLELERWKYRLPGPALNPGPTTIDRLEKVLTERAESLGVTIFQDHGITKILSQDSTSITVETEQNRTFRGRWLVGCDGGRSVVRKAAGFEFVGTEAKFTGYVLKCDLEHSEKLQKGFNPTKAGMYILGQPGSLYLLDFDEAAFDRTQEITLEHMQNVLSRVTGDPKVKITNIHLASSFTDRSKQATSYRKGRVLLAGDAAHIHSPLGAQGLNLGLGDAMNLGWKLAATIRQDSRSDGSSTNRTLLDTYESERHPIAAGVLEWTRAQVSTLIPDLYGTAIQALIRDLINTTDGANLFIDRIWGLSQRYSLGSSEAQLHPLVGCSTPDFELIDGSRLGPRLEKGRGMLLDFGDNAELKNLVLGAEDKLEYLGADAKDKCGLLALLLRPDGVVVWAAEDNVIPDTKAAAAALEEWFAN